MPRLFPGFAQHRIATSGAEIHCVVGGSGPPLLLLHGYPQTHAMWHRVAPRARASASPSSARPARLRRFVEAATAASARRLLEARDGGRPGRGDARARASRVSRSPATTAAGASRIGCASTIRDAVERVAVLDISPTRTMFDGTDQAFATAYYHWFFLIQPFDLPERLIGADPIYYLHRKLGGWGRRDRRSSIRARSPNTSAASPIPRRSMRRARTTARRRRSISSTTRRRGTGAGRVPAAGAVGRRRASCIGCSIRSRTGAAWPRCTRQVAAVAATISPRRRRKRRSPSCRRSSWLERAEFGMARRERTVYGELRANFAIIASLAK